MKPSQRKPRALRPSKFISVQEQLHNDVRIVEEALRDEERMRVLVKRLRLSG